MAQTELQGDERPHAAVTSRQRRRFLRPLCRGAHPPRPEQAVSK